MPYKSPEYLDEKVKALRTPYGHGLVQMIRDLSANKYAQQADELKLANDTNRAQELAALLKGAQGNDPAAFETPYTDPEVQKLAAQLRIKQATEKNSPTMGTSVVWGKDAKGNYVPFQTSSAGGLSQATIPEGIEMLPGAGIMGFDPRMISGATGAKAEQAGAIKGAEQFAVNSAIFDRVQKEAQAKLANAPTVGEATRKEKLAETSTQRAGALATKTSQLDLLDEVANQVKNQAGLLTTGFLGDISKGIGGTPAKDLAANLDTLKSTIGFEKLAEMRANSPTGGALGNVSDRENALLQSVWGALEQSQSPEQLKKNVERVQEQAKKSWANVKKAYEIDYGTPYPEDGVQQTNAPSLDDLLKKYGQ